MDELRSELNNRALTMEAPETKDGNTICPICNGKNAVKLCNDTEATPEQFRGKHTVYCPDCMFSGDAIGVYLRKYDITRSEAIRVITLKYGDLPDTKEAMEAELKSRTGEAMLDKFLETVKEKDFAPIATGISDIDKALNGGFIRKTLVTLGAPPAMGKTALAQWIFENMAKAGNDVLYINLEMAREQLLARSISRLVWQSESKDLNALDILRGYSWTEDQAASVAKAAETYKKEIAPHFIYNPDGVTNNINNIIAAMEAETIRIKDQGKPEPLICIDYLQLIDSGERDAIEGMKNVIFKLKDFAKTHNTVIFVIVANNRASNKLGTVEMESGRDTSAIEYSGDLMLGLAYTAIEDRRKYQYSTDKNGNGLYKEYDLEEIRRLKKQAYEEGKPIPSVCNEVSLKVLKSRFSEAERRANLLFDGKHSTFKLLEYKASQFNDNTQEQEEDGDGWQTFTGKLPFDD